MMIGESKARSSDLSLSLSLQLSISIEVWSIQYFDIVPLRKDQDAELKVLPQPVDEFLHRLGLRLPFHGADTHKVADALRVDRLVTGHVGETAAGLATRALRIFLEDHLLWKV